MATSHSRTTSDTLSDGLALVSLRRRWVLVGLLYVAVWWLGYQLLKSNWPIVPVDRWLIGAGVMLLITMGIFWWGLQYNRRTEESVLWPTLGYGNGLSLVRGLLLCLLTGFVLLPRPEGLIGWVPSLLFTVDRLIDLFDGYVARITNRESKLGALLDIEFDGLDVLVAVVLGIQYGLLPGWYIILAMSRQLFVAGMWLRTRSGKANRELPPSDNRRLIAGFQTGFLSVILWPLFSPPTSTLAAVLFAIPLIYSFGRDWLVVSHVIDPNVADYLVIRNRIKQFFEGWLPCLARVVAAWLSITILWREPPLFLQWRPFFTQANLQNTDVFLPVLTIFFVIFAIGVFLGVLGRVAAVGLIYLACLEIWSGGFLWHTNALLLICAVIVAHLGSGYLALWQPEEYLLRMQMGQSKTAP